MKTLISLLLSVLVPLALPLQAGIFRKPAADKPKTDATETPAPTPGIPIPSAPPIIRVNSTNQPPDLTRPWDKQAPYPRRGTGAILEGGRVIVTASLIAHHAYIELEKPVTKAKSPAHVLAVDYDANLALLAPVNPRFLDGMGYFALEENARIGDTAYVLQIEDNDEIARTAITITTIAVMPYPFETIALLAYRASFSLQLRDNSRVLPVVKNDKLFGLLSRYNFEIQAGEILPASIIAQFLARAFQTPYVGFPKAGIGFASTRDPQFRAYIGLGERDGGIYITEVLPGTPAAAAGIRRGDIILSVDGHAIDADGLYDSPFGKILFIHLITSRPPDAPPTRWEILRNDKIETVTFLPVPANLDAMASRPYLFDADPQYIILGGLVFQELSRPYLRMWDDDWRREAPQRLVYLDAFQNELPVDRGKIIIVSGVLSSEDTIGYDHIRNIVVTNINGVDIKSLFDIKRATARPIDGFHRIQFEEAPYTIYLDAEAIAAHRAELFQHYGIPETPKTAVTQPAPMPTPEPSKAEVTEPAPTPQPTRDSGRQRWQR